MSAYAIGKEEESSPVSVSGRDSTADIESPLGPFAFAGTLLENASPSPVDLDFELVDQPTASSNYATAISSKDNNQKRNANSTNGNGAMCSILDLPDEIIKHRVFQSFFFGKRNDLLNFALVCKRWCLLARSDDVWRMSALQSALTFNPIHEYFYDYYYNPDAALEAAAARAEQKGKL